MRIAVVGNVVCCRAETTVEERLADIMVTYQGAVYWGPQRVYRSACLVDVTHFPFDEHECHMWFQSMSRYHWQLDISPFPSSPWDMETYLESFKESQEWEVMHNSTARFVNSRDVGVLLKFSRRVALRFTLKMRRRISYTARLLMLPCVFLGCMCLVVFCLPPDRPDRHTLGTNYLLYMYECVLAHSCHILFQDITVSWHTSCSCIYYCILFVAASLFGSFMVLTLILVEVAPPTASAVPKLGKYFLHHHF